jgi:acetyl-CoA C-acetyltransferase
MPDALICEPLRTPVGRFGGIFRDVAVTELATAVISAVIERAQLDPAAIDDVILGQGYANGEAPALGRVAGLDAGLPVEVPGVQVDRRCGSGLQAICDAAMQVQTGVADVVIAGGAESMSQTELFSTTLRWGARSGGAMLEDRLVRGRITAGAASTPAPAMSRTSSRCAPTSLRSPPRTTARSRRRSCPSRSPTARPAAA